MRLRCFVILCGLSVGLGLPGPSALAVGPTIVYAPAADADGNPDGTSASPSFEIQFGAGSPTGCTASACAINLTPNCSAPGCTYTEPTVLNCTVLVSDSGDAVFGPTDLPAFVFDSAATHSINLTCTAGTGNSIGHLSCSEKAFAGTTIQRVWDLICPPTAQPEFTSTPAAGSTLNLSSSPGVTVTQSVHVQNIGTPGSSMSVVPSGLSGVLSVAPNGSQALAQNASVDFVVSCTPATAGTTVQQALVLDSNDADEGHLTYTVNCAAPNALPEYSSAPAAPALAQIVTTRPSTASTGLLVTNIGAGTLLVNSISGLAAPFSVSPPGASLGAGLSQNFQISCAGTQSGFFSTLLTVNTNDSDEGAVQYQATCVVKAPEIDSTPTPNATIGIATSQGTNKDFNLTVRNLNPPADGDLQVSSVSGLSGALSIVSAGNFSVAPGAQSDIVIRCNAASVGSTAQTLSVSSNDQDEGTLTYPVSCDVSAALQPEFNPSFPPTQPIAIATAQGSNGSKVLTVQNVGSSNLTVLVSTNPAGPKISLSPNAGAGTLTLVPNQTQAYTIGCDASSAGTFNDSFRLTTNDSDEGLVIFNVTCNVSPTAPEFTSTPAAPGNFALSTNQGTNTSTTFSVRNDGSATLSIASISGASAPISVAPSTFSLAPGLSQTVTVSCDASNAGTFSRSFTVNTNDSDESAVGYAVNCVVAARPPEFQSSPAGGSSIALSAAVGATSNSSLTVFNVAALGPANLTIAASGLGAPLSINPPTSSIPVLGNTAFNIGCAPTSGGTVTQTLALDTNDTDEDPVNYSVSCTGLAPEFTSFPPAGRPTSLSVRRGGSGSFTVRVRNDGVSSLTVSASGLSGLLSVAPLGTLGIAPGGVQDFTVTCTGGTTSGSVLQTLTLTNNDSDENPATYPVSCFVSSGLPISRRVSAALSSDVFLNGVVNIPIFKDGFE